MNFEQIQCELERLQEELEKAKEEHERAYYKMILEEVFDIKTLLKEYVESKKKV